MPGRAKIPLQTFCILSKRLRQAPQADFDLRFHLLQQIFSRFEPLVLVDHLIQGYVPKLRNQALLAIEKTGLISSMKTRIQLALMGALISIALHLYLTMHYYPVKFGFAAGQSICNLNAKFNCD